MFSDHEQLVIQPDIDVVVVTVKVPRHRELVSAALVAGNAVYCERPLGRDLDDARAMAALAAERGVRTVVGLQARQAPAIEFVQDLLRDGYVGEILSTTGPNMRDGLYLARQARRGRIDRFADGSSDVLLYGKGAIE